MEPLNEFFSWNLRHINAEGERLMIEDELLELFERMEADDLPETAIDFEVHYLVRLAEGEARVFGWMSGDEQALLRQHGVM